MSSSSWLRRGSSTVFDRHTLGPLIGSGALVSLREALRWMKGWPSDPPGCPNIRFQVLCLSRHRSWNSPASRKRRNPLLEDDNQIRRGERLQLGCRALQTIWLQMIFFFQPLNHLRIDLSIQILNDSVYEIPLFHPLILRIVFQ